MYACVPYIYYIHGVFGCRQPNTTDVLLGPLRPGVVWHMDQLSDDVRSQFDGVFNCIVMC